MNSRLQHFQSSIPPPLRQRIIRGVITGLSVSIIFHMVKNYQAWKSAGVSGLPLNPLGWSLQWLLRLIARGDTLNTACYSQPSIIKIYGNNGQKNYLGQDFPSRKGGRPPVLPWVAPHRQDLSTGSEEPIREVNYIFLPPI